MIERCWRRMSSYGWAMVKACADEVVAAERQAAADWEAVSGKEGSKVLWTARALV